ESITISRGFRPTRHLLQEDRMQRPAFFSVLLSLTLLADVQAQSQANPSSTRDRDIKIVEQIKRADYEGDRAALQRLHGELTPSPDNKTLSSRELYWRGFALWRRAINGFNESPTPKDLQEDLNGAIA